MPRPKSKQCIHCKKRKQLVEFVRSVHAKDGYLKYCRPCHGKRCRDARNKNQAANGKTNGKAKANGKTNGKALSDINTALKVANGHSSKRSPFRGAIKELYARFANDGFEVEHLEFVGNTVRVRYSRTEEIQL